MANEEHVEILRQGVKIWNEWRKKNPDIEPNLTWAELGGANLEGANLEGANLAWANLSRTNLAETNLIQANLERAKMQLADLRGANLGWAELGGAYLLGADLRGANLDGTMLFGKDIEEITRGRVLQVEQESQLVIRVTMDESTDENKVVKGIVELYRALNAYHIACGGCGLEIDDWQTFIGTAETAGVLV